MCSDKQTGEEDVSLCNVSGGVLVNIVINQPSFTGKENSRPTITICGRGFDLVKMIEST